VFYNWCAVVWSPGRLSHRAPFVLQHVPWGPVWAARGGSPIHTTHADSLLEESECTVMIIFIILAWFSALFIILFVPSKGSIIFWRTTRWVIMFFSLLICSYWFSQECLCMRRNRQEFRSFFWLSRRINWTQLNSLIPKQYLDPEYLFNILGVQPVEIRCCDKCVGRIANAVQTLPGKLELFCTEFPLLTRI
jgi:hypothetical protein